ncbi:MAG: hypothetical protein DRM99_00885 [Thermoplasmata archaeon]|nr:MAG: hypothetical protein DRM99_00885 [Thermoplasmata archaeon]
MDVDVLPVASVSFILVGLTLVGMTFIYFTSVDYNEKVFWLLFIPGVILTFIGFFLTVYTMLTQFMGV